MSVHRRLCKVSGSADFSRLGQLLNSQMPSGIPPTDQILAKARQALNSQMPSGIPSTNQMLAKARELQSKAANYLNAPAKSTDQPAVNATSNASLSDRAEEMVRNKLKSTALMGTGIVGGLGLASASNLGE